MSYRSMPPIRKNTTIFFTTGRYLALVVAPFAITPLWLGLLTWSVAQSLFILGGQDATGDQAGTHLYLLVLCPRVAYLAFHVAIQYQYRRYHCPRYVLIEEKDVWAAFVIMLGTFTKLYGITGLAFFFLSP